MILILAVLSGFVLLLGIVVFIVLNESNKKKKPQQGTSEGGGGAVPGVGGGGDDDVVAVDDGGGGDGGAAEDLSGDVGNLHKDGAGNYHILSDTSLNWGRYQADNNEGYCGECSMQMIALGHGVWLPQWKARDLGNDGDHSYELILSDGEEGNMTKALRLLKMRYSLFKGSGYAAFVAWGKQQLKRGCGFIYTTFHSSGNLTQYDHIVPMVALSKDEGSWWMYHCYDEKAVKVTTGSGYSCTRSKGNSVSNSEGGCVNVNTKWGISILGPAYAGIGPPVELLSLSDPAESTSNLSKSTNKNMKCTVRCHKLTSGTKYAVYKVVGEKNAPSSKSAKLSGTPIKTFTASGSSYKFQSSFQSKDPTYFICVAA